MVLAFVLMLGGVALMVTLENELLLSVTVLGFALMVAAVPSLPREPEEARDSPSAEPSDAAGARRAGAEEAAVVPTPRRMGNVRVLARGEDQPTDEQPAPEEPSVAGDSEPAASSEAAARASGRAEPDPSRGAEPADRPAPAPVAAPLERRPEPPPQPPPSGPPAPSVQAPPQPTGEPSSQPKPALGRRALTDVSPRAAAIAATTAGAALWLRSRIGR